MWCFHEHKSMLFWYFFVQFSCTVNQVYWCCSKLQIWNQQNPGFFLVGSGLFLEIVRIRVVKILSVRIRLTVKSFFIFCFLVRNRIFLELRIRICYSGVVALKEFAWIYFYIFFTSWFFSATLLIKYRLKNSHLVGYI